MFAVIDIETTGGSAARDRITEIAVLLHDGQQTVRTFSTLINPEIPIPRYITEITGINDAMVADAPRFYEVAREIVELTEGCIFVAHNVNFDYGFIVEEFKRLAYTYTRERLCTVRTSRRLIPGQATYSLGRLCASIGIPLRDRHRALGDAAATVLLLERLIGIDSSLGGAVKRDAFAGVPVAVPRARLHALPEDPGVFYLHGAQGDVLLAAKADNVRKEVLRLLKAKKPMVALAGTCDISWELTGSELLADLRLLAEEPAEKPARPTPRFKAAVYAYRDQRDYIRLVIDTPSKGRKSLCEFSTEAEARAALESRVKNQGLCRILCGLSPNAAHCSQYPGGDCNGACMGHESPDAYNSRVEAALGGLGFPFPRFLLLSDGRSREEVSVICVDNGGCIAYGYLDATVGWEDPAAVADLLSPFPNPGAGGRIIRSYLPKMNSRKILPY
jgi:DNA polymerase III subunit epsilon